MSRRINVYASALLVLFELTASTVVLPRPPSSLNHIRQDQELSARKALGGKSLHGVSRDSNVERSNANEDYRYYRRRSRSCTNVIARAASYEPLFLLFFLISLN